MIHKVVVIWLTWCVNESVTLDKSRPTMLIVPLHSIQLQGLAVWIQCPRTSGWPIIYPGCKSMAVCLLCGAFSASLLLLTFCSLLSFGPYVCWWVSAFKEQKMCLILQRLLCTILKKLEIWCKDMNNTNTGTLGKVSDVCLKYEICAYTSLSEEVFHSIKG